MNRSLLDVAQQQIAISSIDLLISLLVASALGLVIVVVYRWTQRGLHYERSFLVSLIMVPPIVSVVMMLIGSNLAMSLGMVGALSIIRFRTVIKDSRDMVFLFFSIAVGLGCGTYNWVVIAASTAYLSLALVVLHATGFGTRVHAEYALVLTGSGSPPTSELVETIHKYVGPSELRSMNVREENWEFVFEVQFLNKGALGQAELFDALKSNYQVESISLLAPQLSLPV